MKNRTRLYPTLLEIIKNVYIHKIQISIPQVITLNPEVVKRKIPDDKSSPNKRLRCNYATPLDFLNHQNGEYGLQGVLVGFVSPISLT